MQCTNFIAVNSTGLTSITPTGALGKLTQLTYGLLAPGNVTTNLMAAGITHVTVTFDGAGDSGQIESIGAWSGETAVEFPETEIAYAALTWDDPEVEMRQLSLVDVVEQLAYDFLSDTHGGWENNDGAWGEFCFDAAARCIHLEFNERFTSSELYTHDF